MAGRVHQQYNAGWTSEGYAGRWCDAHLKMDEYKVQIAPKYQDYPKPANNFRQAMIDLNPTLRSYDSSWR